MQSRSSSDAYNIVRHQNVSFYNGVWIVLALYTYTMPVANGSLIWHQCFFFSLSLIFVLDSINFQRKSLIYFSVRFNPYFFLLSVLFEIIHKIRFFLISLLFKFFHLLDLVLILFITICFVFNLFLNWYLFFKCILQHFISFISYVNFYPYSFNFYFFCFKFFFYWNFLFQFHRSTFC